MAKQVSSLGLPLHAAPWALLRWSYRVGRNGIYHAIDAALGVRTTPPIPYGPFLDLQLRPSNMQTGWILIWRLLRGERPTADDVLLDIGCGTGRSLLCGAMLPFRRVIGLDFDAESIRQARANVATFRSRARSKVELVHGDATRYAIPDDVTLIFFFNSFRNPIFAAMHDNIRESLRRRPRRLHLIYGNPVEHDWLMGTGLWQVVRSVSGYRPGRDWARSFHANVYEALPEAAGPTQAG